MTLRVPYDLRIYKSDYSAKINHKDCTLWWDGQRRKDESVLNKQHESVMTYLQHIVSFYTKREKSTG